MIKNLKPGCLTKFVIPINIGEYENILAVFLERKHDKRKIDILRFYILKYNKIYETALTPIDLEIISNQ
jgi:hypothetical protein